MKHTFFTETQHDVTVFFNQSTKCTFISYVDTTYQISHTFNRVFITNPSIVYMGSQRQFSLLYFGCGLDSFALRQLVMSLGLGISHFGHF